MKYNDMCVVLEDKYKKIQFLQSTGNYDEAANNIRKIVEMICDYYGEMYHISVFKTENYKLYEKIKYLQRNDRIDKNTGDAFFTLKNLGNIGSHYNENEKVSKTQIDKAIPVVKAEIDKFKHIAMPTKGMDETCMLFAFKSLADEGWEGKENIRSEFIIQKEDDNNESYYVENISYILSSNKSPVFLYDYVTTNKLPLIAWNLDKRIIKQKQNEYFCHAYVPVFGNNGDILRIEGHFIKENANNEVIVYEVKCGDKIVYCYNKFARQLTGIWIEKKVAIENSLTALKLQSEKGLSCLQKKKELMLAFHYCLPAYTPYLVNGVCCIDDENHMLAMAMNLSGDVIYEQDDVPAKVKVAIGDLFRLQCLCNCLKKYLKNDEQIDNWKDISCISVRDGIYNVPFLYDYYLGFERNERQASYKLIDSYSDKVFSFGIINNGTFLPVVNEYLSNAPIEIDFKAFLKKMKEIGSYGLSELLVEGVSYEAIVKTYQSILQQEEDAREVERLNREEEKHRKELIQKEYEENQRKLAEYMVLEEKKRKKEEKKRKKKIGVGIAISLAVVVIFCIAIILPIVALLIYQKTPKYININDYVSVEVNGYEGVGEAEVVFDYERLEEDYGDKIKFNDTWYSPSGQTDFDSFLGQCNYVIEGNGQLSNGDEINIVWDINNEDMQTWFNYGVKYKDFNHIVDGLEEIDFFDAFDSLTYSIDGVSLDATLSMRNTINIDGYPGFLFTCDKTEGIANNDIITISLITENGDDLYDYCADRFNAIPEQKEIEIVVSGLSEYVMSYDEISEEQLQVIIDEGEQHLCDYYNYEEYYGKSCEAEYVGNYFMSTYSNDSEIKNRLCMVYYINRTIYDEGPGSSYYAGSYDFYAIYILRDISVTSEGELNINYDDWYFTDASEVEFEYEYPGWSLGNTCSVYGFETVSQIYPEYIYQYEEYYNIQNNMQSVIDSDG